MLEVAILGLLKQQPMHGYQLSRELGESLGGFWRVSYGSLYPTLRRLERDGSVEPEQTEAVGGRRKTVYRITESGEQAFLRAAAGDAGRGLGRGHQVPRTVRVLPVPAARRPVSGCSSAGARPSRNGWPRSTVRSAPTGGGPTTTRSR